MNKAQSNQFRMYLSTQDFLENQSNVWSTIAQVAVYKSQFDELIDRMAAKAEEAGDSVGISYKKEKLKTALR